MIYTVYYQRFFGLLRPAETQLKYLNFSHRLLRQLEAGSLEDVYRQQQGEIWSPQGEARRLIERLHLGHTSLSVGDVVRDPGGHYWVCNDRGWLPLWPSGWAEPGPTLWLATEAHFRGPTPHITRLKISDDLDCLPPDAWTVERFAWLPFADLVALANLIEGRRGWPVCIDLGDDFYETEAA
jgi:hypothetical protein